MNFIHLEKNNKMSKTAQLTIYDSFLPALNFQGVSNFLQKRLVYHAIFWLALYVFNIVYLAHIINYTYAFYSYTIRLPFLILFSYCHIHFFLPRFLLNKQYTTYFLTLLVSVPIMAILIQAIFDSLYTFQYCPLDYAHKAVFNAPNTVEKMVSIVMIMGLTTGIKLSKDWINHKQKIEDIEKQNLKNELDFLKTQIQPHFFFNTLNNLYSLTIKKSDLAPEIVLKLSDLMGYMLYECDAQKISLMKEITHIQNYLDLEALRFGKRLEINFELSGQLENYYIAPLVLLPFIENSFKHGVANQLSQIHINLALKIQDQTLIFEIENPKSTMELEQCQKNKIYNGLGLKNVNRRLELLYGDKYSLTIKDGEETYKVILQIPIE